MSIFNQIQKPRVKSNVFDLSHDHKLSLNTGNLVPIHVAEVLPGDHWRHSCSTMLRMAPLISPVMHNVDVTTHFFFVPNRLVWDGWQDFITGNVQPPPAVPYITDFNNTAGSFYDYMGIPLGQIDAKINALPFAAYNLIFNEYYRDQNLVAELPGTKLLDGLNPDVYTLLRRAWEHDYFTSALPFAQKGDPVRLPLTGNAPVVFDPDASNFTVMQQLDGGAIASGDVRVSSSGPGAGRGFLEAAGGSDIGYDPNGTLEADLSSVTSATINELRIAVRLQEWLEKNARAGTRYIESILAHFGVRSSDARLQRPEFLGGSKAPMVISEVLQTAQTDETPQGNMAGHGISVGQGNQFSYHAEEHGYIIGIMSVRPKTAYQQGIPAHYDKFDQMDYAFPEFAHLGEQPIKNQELYYNSVDGEPVNQATFGYKPIYSEYKFKNSQVSGKFRTDLNFWHWGRIFPSRPGLNETFIQCNPDKRIFAVEDPSVEELYAHVYHSIKVNRKLPYFGTPTL